MAIGISPLVDFAFKLMRESSSDLILTNDLQIHLLQMNHLRVTVEEFAGYDEARLTDMADQLQQQPRMRGETG